MMSPPPAVHRTILAVDVEGFGDPRRTTAHQVAVRDGLYRALERACAHANVAWAQCHREDRGDGVVLLAPAQAPKAPFVESLPPALVTELREHNATHPVAERIRLRVALHAGEVAFDDHGVTAGAVTLTFRLMDAPAVKAALAESPGVLAVITSGWFFDEVVANSAVLDPATFRPARVAVKETSIVAWICRPDHPYPADAGQLTAEAAGAAGTPGVTMTATTSDHSRVYQAARDQHITREVTDAPQ